MRLVTLAWLVLALAGCSSDSSKVDAALADHAQVSELSPGSERGADQPSGIDQATVGPEGGVPPDLALPDKGPLKDKGTNKDKTAVPDGPTSCSATSKLRCDCTAYSTKAGKYLPLKGKVNEVSFNADFKVKVVNSLGQLKVKQVTVLPNNCGEWQGVTALPAFTYQIVTVGEDFTIQYDQIFPGVNKAVCAGCN